MLTIGQLATYAGVTPRAVRHYHQVGLLPEPERDVSGYRSYGVQDVVALIRVRTLAEAGVPLARVRDLLDADEAELAAAVAEIDRRLRAEIRERQEHRRRIAQLAAGDSLVLPPEVVGYLDRLRELGMSSLMVDGERDGWILVAARWPEQVPAFMAAKIAHLEDPKTLQLYRVLDALAAGDPDEGELAAAADLMVALLEESAARGELDDQVMDEDPFVDLLDSLADGAHPLVRRLRDLLAERGWAGWTVNKRAGSSEAAEDGTGTRAGEGCPPERSA